MKTRAALQEPQELQKLVIMNTFLFPLGQNLDLLLTKTKILSYERIHQHYYEKQPPPL